MHYFRWRLESGGGPGSRDDFDTFTECGAFETDCGLFNRRTDFDREREFTNGLSESDVCPKPD